MLLAEPLPQSDITNVISTIPKTNEDMPIKQKVQEAEEEEENHNIFTSIKIPLVSFQPILAVSHTHIMVNEHTKKKKQLVFYDTEFNRSDVRYSIEENFLDALSYDKGQYFLILTPTNIYKSDAITKQFELIKQIIPTEKKPLKAFALLNPSTLLLAYDEWGTKQIEIWQSDDENNWIFLEKKTLEFNFQEFMGHMTVIEENNMKKLILTIYNEYKQEWRMEIRNAETFEKCQENIRLPSANQNFDYKCTPIENSKDDIKWLCFSSANVNVTAIDGKNQLKTVKYRNPIQNMSITHRNYLVVRTTQRIDIHLFA